MSEARKFPDPGAHRSARLAGQLAPQTCLPPLPQHRDCRNANTLVGFLMLLLRFELRSLCSHGKNLTDSAISSASASHILTPNDHKAEFPAASWRPLGSLWESEVRVHSAQCAYWAMCPLPSGSAAQGKRMQAMKWEDFGTQSCS